VTADDADTATRPVDAGSPVPFDPTGPLPGGRTLLEASAGTGKTYTITSLVLRLVAEEGMSVTRLLVVTFTRAATAELRDRVRTRLADALAAVEDAVADPRPGIRAATGDAVIDHVVDEGRRGGRAELQRRLRALRSAREEFDDATISTIHGFCQQALARAGLDVDVDLEAELTEDLTDLLEEVVDDYLVRHLRGADHDLVSHLRAQRVGRGDLLEIARRVEAEPDLRLHPDLDGEEDLVEAWRSAVEDCRRRWQEGCAEVGAWLDAHREAGGLSGYKYNADRVADKVAAITAWCDRPVPPIGDLEEVRKALEYFGAPALAKNLVDDVPLAPPPSAIEAARELASCPTRPATLLRIRFARHAVEEVARRKRQRGVLSFSDLLLTLHRALEDPTTRDTLVATIRDQYDVGLIDEFQDTDPVQWAVFDRVFPPGDRLLLIGDPKQAIYAFRGADIATYLRAAASAQERYTLPNNFRSDQRYLDGLNRVLARPDAFGPGRIEYHEVRAPEHHQRDRLAFPDRARPTLELRHVPREVAGPGASKTITKGWAARWLPRHVAAEIVELLDSGATLDTGAGDRPVAPGDVAVLTRTNRQADLVQRALRDVGVPAVVGTEHSVFATPEALAVQRVLDALVRVGAEREARAALATPLIGVTGEELADLDGAGWDVWLQRLEAWAAAWRRGGVAAALRQLLADTDAFRRLLAHPRGERSITNVRHLIELLHGVESTRRLGPTGVTAWLREQRHHETADTPRGVELRLESDADAVQVLTVHRSKGLQYPIVWCPWLWEGTAVAQGEQRTLRFHDPADDALALDLDLAHKVDPKAHHLAVAGRERWEEGLRLAYVALTRAEHRCVVHTGAFGGSGPSALGHLLHDRGLDHTADGRPVLPDDPKDVPDEQLLADLRELASDAVGIAEVPARPAGQRWRPDRRDAATPPLAVRVLDRRIDRAWQRTSFSRLARDEDAEPGSPRAEGRDHDELAAEETVTGAPGPVAGPPDAVDGLGPRWDEEVPLAHIARGADAGVLLHGVLEHLDFTLAREPDAVEDRIRDLLPRSGLPGPVDVLTMAGGIRAAVATPLGPLVGDAALADVPVTDRLDELDFDLPIAGGYDPRGRELTLTRIADVLADHARDDATLAQAAARLRTRPSLPVRGFLTGSIDLVARVDGRVVIVDYKSNWLGDRGDRAAGLPDQSRLLHYHPARLGPEMVGHDYLLQAHLYLVAVHRYLRWRMGAAYDYDRDVAGVLYLFLRGMVGADTPRDAKGTPAGVHARRAPLALVEDLDRVLRGDA
jgi:exodeoxyribonuclease V beta subunit